MFILGNEIALVRNRKAITRQWIDRNYIELVDSDKREKIRSKLLGGSAFITHCTGFPALLCWYDGHKVWSRICGESWGLIPENRACSFDNFSDVKAIFKSELIPYLPENYLKE